MGNAVALYLFLTLVLSACAAPPMFIAGNTTQPAAEAAVVRGERLGPLPPTAHPDPLGGVAEFHLLEGFDDALACLAGGQPAYAVMQRNANVRNGPAAESCRLGRAPAGSLVRVEAIYPQNRDTPLATLDRRQAVEAGALLGYAEDVQPIFAKVCTACHGEDVQQAELKVTDYPSLMAGSVNGAVVVPGAPQESRLWQQIASGTMPLVGELSAAEKETIRAWIESGAAQKRPERPAEGQLWLRIAPADYSMAANDCAADGGSTTPFIDARLARPASCAAIPEADQIAQYLPQLQSAPAAREAGRAPGDGATASVQAAAPRAFPAGSVGIQAAPLGLPAPSEDDPWMTPRGGFCIEQHLQDRLAGKSITSLAFAPDGRLFLGLDSPATGEFDPIVLFDAFHPSRSIAVYNSVSRDSFNEILTESGRITGMVWHDGALYLNRAGEVGRIPDGGSYQRLAAGFAVNGRLFHANNGIAIVDGWLYISAGGVRDGYSDGVIAPGDGDVPAETMSVNIAGGGNRYAARIVRAPLDRLLTERTLGVFQTAARGVRNPYGLTADPFGRLWFTDNGATNVEGEYSAGDEVDLLDPHVLPAAAVAGDESATPYYGFPMALAGIDKEWWTPPVLPLLNTAAPTGITWAYGTIYFAQYGRDPGLYRLANAGGHLVGERILLAWPVQAVTTAPDGALWIGTGEGGLYRLAPGCNG